MLSPLHTDKEKGGGGCRVRFIRVRTEDRRRRALRNECRGATETGRKEVKG